MFLSLNFEISPFWNFRSI